MSNAIFSYALSFSMLVLAVVCFSVGAPSLGLGIASPGGFTGTQDLSVAYPMLLMCAAITCFVFKKHLG